MLLLFVVVQSCSYVWLVVTPGAVACQASVSFTGLLKFLSIESVMLSNHLTHCCPLLLRSICLNISVFSNESAFHMRWPKYWNCSISSSDEYSGLISFRIDDLIPLQSKGLKSFLHRHSSKASILCIRWPKYWGFSFSISPSNEYSEQISFRIDLFDLLAVQGTLKSLLQHHNLKASILWCSASFGNR